MKNLRVSAAFTIGCLLAVANPLQSYGQTDSDFLSENRPRNSRLDASIGFGKKCNLNTFQWTRFKALDKKNRFHLGAGMRINNLNYNGFVMKAEGSNETGFSQFTSAGHLVSVNLMLAGEFLWDNQYGLGGNTDAFGMALGSVLPSDGQNDFNYTKEGNPGITPGEIGAEVSFLNLRKTGNKNLGTLNSEIYGLYKFRKRTWVKAGYSRVCTDLNLSHPKDRFTATSNVFFVGLRFSY